MNEQIIPRGFTKEEIKAREKIIKKFYATWCAENPEKKVWNEDLKAFICVKFLSINETYSKAARSYESTVAVLRLTDILKYAKKIEEKVAKNNKNQRSFDKMLIMMAYENIKLTVGRQKSSGCYIQYCITAIKKPADGSQQVISRGSK